MTPNVLPQLKALGYEVGIASGGVAAEQEALAGAHELAKPECVAIDASTVTAQTISDLNAAGELPADETERADLVNRIQATVLERVQQARDGEVAMHERALEIARRMPTTYVASGPGITTVYFSLDDETSEGVTENDRRAVKALLDPDAHAERVKQANAVSGSDALSD